MYSVLTQENKPKKRFNIMANATLNIFPTQQQLIDFGYSDLATTYAYMAETFSTTKVACDVALTGGATIKGEWVGPKLCIWIDGIALPFEWFNVIGMSPEEKEIVANFQAQTKPAQSAGNTVTAINKKHQSLVNRFIKADAKYGEIVNATDDNGGLKQERAYDKASELFADLPVREQKNINKTISTIGY